jgi:hypothetical protein
MIIANRLKQQELRKLSSRSVSATSVLKAEPSNNQQNGVAHDSSVPPPEEQEQKASLVTNMQTMPRLNVACA